MGLGIAALSVFAAVDPLTVEARTENISSAPSDLAAGVGEIDIVVREGAHAWFNVNWVEFLGTNGEWDEEVVDDDTTMLRPKNDECSFGVRLLWEKRIVYFPMPTDGELAFDGTWIKVDQTGRGVTLGRNVDGSASAASAEGCDFQIDMSNVADLDFNGDCWTEVPASGCSVSRTCGGNEEGGGCSLRINHNNGTAVVGMSYASECGTTLSVATCAAGGGRELLCINL